MLVKIGDEYLEYLVISANCIQIVDTKKIIRPIMNKNNNIIGLDFIKGRLNLNETLSLNFNSTANKGTCFISYFPHCFSLRNFLI
jgi:hypothetical protein